MGILSALIPVLNIFDRAPNRALKKNSGICSTEADGRILNSDHSGRIYALPGQSGQPRGVRLVSVLSELKVGETGVVDALDLPESVQNYLMHLGFLPNAAVTALRRAPAGDPTVYAVDGMEIALRHETASAIRLRKSEDSARLPSVLNPDDEAQRAEEISISAPTVLIELAEVAR